MSDFVDFDLGMWQWLLLALCGFLVGVSKTGIPGFGILIVPLTALVLPPGIALGVVLPMLIFADLFAAGYWRYHAQWKHLVRLIPWALLGIVTAFMVMGRINDTQLQRIIALIVLIMIAIRLRQNLKKSQDDENTVPKHFAFAPTMGLLAGFSTMVAHAAGPVMTIYLLSMQMPKKKFIGTTAWFFFIINWLKVPFTRKLGLITVESLKLNLVLAPMILIGAVTGIVALKHIPQKAFNYLVMILAAAAAIKLLMPDNWSFIFGAGR